MSARLLDIQAGRQFVDRYELIGEIASGGMATVYLSRLTGVGGFQRLYAIKRLHPHLQGEKEFVEMFLDEARLAAGIHHPNVVPILEVGASQSGYYLVMEYVEGETLARLLARAASRKQRLPIPMVVRMALDTLNGLHAAHELRDETGNVAGVVHRDVSPQNVLIGADGVARITDFGVARAASRLTATRVGQLKGKIAYMAPEQARGEEDMDRRADVFAAGIVFWEALAHRRLFKAQSEAGTLSRVLNEPLPHLREMAPHVDPGICDVVMAALERDKNRRLSSCADFADALERAAAAADLLGTPRDLRSYMELVLGPEIQAQRDSIRAWTGYADSLPSSAPSSAPQLTPSSIYPSATTPGVETLSGGTFPGQRQSSGRWLGVAVALLLLAGGGFFGYRAFSNPASGGPHVGAASTGQDPGVNPLEVDADRVETEPPPASDASGSEPDAGEAGESEGEEANPADTAAEEAVPPPRFEAQPAPRPRPRTSPPASAPRPRPAPEPQARPQPAPSKKSPIDALDSNPYR